MRASDFFTVDISNPSCSFPLVSVLCCMNKSPGGLTLDYLDILLFALLLFVHCSYLTNEVISGIPKHELLFFLFSGCQGVSRV